MNKMFNHSKKSQAALEFLMTYGWAILVVLVAIGALAYFGVLSPDKFLPSKCTLPAGIACADFKLSSQPAAVAPATYPKGTISIVLRNGLGFDLKEVKVSASSCTVSSPTGIELRNGEQQKIDLTACSKQKVEGSTENPTSTLLDSGGKYSGQINVSYKNVDSELTHTVQGVILGRVE